MTPPPAEKEQPQELPVATKAIGREAVLWATVWTVGSTVAGYVLRLVSNLLLARLLFPEAFALLALAAVFMQGLRMFSDIGIGPSVIQSHRGEDPQFLNTAWTMQIARGILIFFGACGLAYPVAQFYQEPLLLWIIPVAAFPSIVSGFDSMSRITMNRKLDLGWIAALGLCESVVKLLVTVSWALVHPSVWAILGGVIVSQLFYTVACHWLLPSHAHRFAWNRQVSREIIRFGGWIFLSTAVTFFAQQTDRLLLGKLVPLGLLGVYSIAQMFARLPMEICGAVTEKVMFPALASVVREEPDRIAEVLFKSRQMLLTIGAAGTVGFMAGAPWFFHIGYDERYHEAVWMAPLLGLATWFAILQSTCDRALLALGDTRTLFLSNLANFGVTVCAGLIGFQVGGMAGFIIGFGVGNLAGHLVVMVALIRLQLRIVTQDLSFTAAVLLMAGIGVWLPSKWSMDLATEEGLLRISVQLAVGIGAGLIALREALNAFHRK